MRVSRTLVACAVRGLPGVAACRREPCISRAGAGKSWARAAGMAIARADRARRSLEPACKESHVQQFASTIPVLPRRPPQPASAFDANPYLNSGNFAPITHETTASELRVRGRIPRELNGRYLRNGPSPIGPRDPSTYHWFSGTGLVHGLRLRLHRPSRG